MASNNKKSFESHMEPHARRTENIEFGILAQVLVGDHIHISRINKNEIALLDLFAISETMVETDLAGHLNRLSMNQTLCWLIVISFTLIFASRG
jgi:hypothetical protein